jgi:hypothetical protein
VDTGFSRKISRQQRDEIVARSHRAMIFRHCEWG